MSKVFLGSSLTQLDIGEPAKPVSKVILSVGAEKVYVAGDDTGAVLECECLWGSEDMAKSILSDIEGHVYLPFSGSGAFLDPAAELGDGITLGGSYTVLAKMGRQLSGGNIATVEAPGIDEIEDERIHKTRQRKWAEKVIAMSKSIISKSIEEVKISVERINEDLTENYAKLSVVSDMISSEVSAELYTDDVDEDGNPIKVAKYSTVEQTAESITAAINGLDGKYLEVSLLPDGMFVKDDNGNYTKISGGYIEANSITGDKFAANVEMTAPKIVGGAFYDSGENGKLTLGVDAENGSAPWLIFSDETNGTSLFEVVSLTESGSSPAIVLGGTVLCSKAGDGKIYFGNNVDFSGISATAVFG